MNPIAPISLGGRARRAPSPLAPRPPRVSLRRSVPLTGLSVLLGSLLALSAIGGSLGHAPQVGSWAVLALDQTNYTVEQGTFTVSVEVASPADVQSAAFSFCQLSSAVCYQPVPMSLHGSNWFEGTTDRMSTYSGMKEGVQAGYNITILYANNTIVHEPSLPNAFASLAVGTEVNGEYMYEMTVSPQLYGLSGDLTDATTHAAVAGATVTITPNGTAVTTTASGAYSFPGLVNGSYSLLVSGKGYPASAAILTINGQDLVKDLVISNSTGLQQPSGSQPSGKSGLGYFTTTPGLVVLGVAILVGLAVVLVVVAVLRNRKPAEPGPSTSSDGTEPGPSSRGPPP